MMIMLILRVCFVATTVAMSFVCLVAQAALVTESGSLFDITYNDSGFWWETGTDWDPDAAGEVPVYEQIGGYTIVDSNTIRYFLPPEDVQRSDPWTYEVIPGGDVEVGGYALSTDYDSASGTFQIIPTAGAPIQGITMTVNGTYSNPVEDATILYTEQITAGGDTGSQGYSLGIYSSGSLPTGSSVAFAETLSPIDVDFQVTLDATSSDLWDTSHAWINRIDFTVHRVPEPSSVALMVVALYFGLLRFGRG